MFTALGVVLAAGQGRRMGLPKALLRTADGESWAARAARLLREGGCTRVAVTVGAAAEAVRRTLPANAVPIEVPGFATGIGAGVRAALRHAEGTDADVAVFLPVDLPYLQPGDVAAVLAVVGEPPGRALVRAGWKGRGGHPVVVGRGFWREATAVAVGDAGLRELFQRYPGVGVPCAASVRDVDEQAELPAGTLLPTTNTTERT